MDLAEDLRASLQDILVPGAVEIRENGSRVTSATPLSWEVRGNSEKPLLHLWSENCNVTRRVVAITGNSQDHLALAVERFGRSKPERMEIVRLEYAPAPRDLSREAYCEQLRRILAEQFPDETLEKISAAQDLEHSLSKIYIRGILQRGSAHVAFLAVSEGESQDALESSLTYGLLWLEKSRQSAKRAALATLRLILPKGKSQILANRLRALDPRLGIEIYELDPQRETLERVDPCATGNVASWLVPHRESQLLLDRASSALEPLIALSPESIRAHASPHTQEVVLRFRGLAFARWQENRVFFGCDSTWAELRNKNEPALKQLIANLQNFRNPLASNVRHALYRAQAERWMQTLVHQDVSRIDISLDPEHVYEQVFAHVARQHGILDLLCITRSRRLAILELKATENVDLPLQAADYWSRIRWHQLQGDFARYGYFPGIELQPAPPLVYLIAPALRFHPTTDVLHRYLYREMEIIRVGLAESWRRGLRVMFRQ
ncbi:MAG TPA: hypothetical protein VK805_08380 [Candidatus Baltobacteraceae bacterium]|nr:hypothetical protein [Candidatus Baltobacteraceae bacterium]